eukprot:TRINITY_DN5732_c0_g2_i1.p1 TRINITY_DN5732_c0_g2~~TRINITY_DN5732_c0_g2_i1.p1  ORF type:complete len:603 (-),score=148.24 TRINITY_DN5732_c0_g2_i1:157-1965(-)
MVLGDITNTVGLACGDAQWKKVQPASNTTRTETQERLQLPVSATGGIAAEGDKALWANALWDQINRQKALQAKVEEVSKRLKEAQKQKATALQRVDDIAIELAKEVDSNDMKLFQLSEHEAQVLQKIESLREEAAPFERTHELLTAGIQAKESDLHRGWEEVSALGLAKIAKEKEGEAKVARSAVLKAVALSEEQQAVERSDFMAQNVPATRSLHNSYLNLKGNIRVFCRFRPALSDEGEELTKVVFHDEQHVTLNSEVQKSVTGLSEHSNSWDFGFDRVFSTSSTQADIFEEISLLVQSALDGYRVAIFAYGQTGGGKTYTMDGPQGTAAPPEVRGVIPRTVDLIFREVEEMRDKGWKFEVSCTLLEVYNEAVHDILGSRSAAGVDKVKDAKPAAGTDARQSVDQFTARTVRNAADVHRLLAKASRERHVAATACNDRSSRSHAVFQLAIKGQREEGEQLQEVSGLLSLVDLAGSERVDRSQVTGERLKEAQYINKSLSALGDVVEALAKRGGSGCSGTYGSSCHIPYRNSRLTMLLKESLGGDSKALMFVNVSPCLQHLPETLSSLRFASKVHACNIGVAKRHAVDKSGEGLQKAIRGGC